MNGKKTIFRCSQGREPLGCPAADKSKVQERTKSGCDPHGGDSGRPAQPVLGWDESFAARAEGDGTVGVRELKEEALDLYAQRRFTECVQTYERLLELNPRDPSLYMGQAEAYRGAGSRREALNAFRMAAELLLDQGDKARARAALKAALELNPRNKEVARALEELPPTGEETPPSTVAAPEALFELPQEKEQPRAWQRSAPVNVPPRAVTPQAELRRLSDNTLAVRAGPGMPWIVVSSQTPLLTYEVDDLEQVAERSYPQEVRLQH